MNAPTFTVVMQVVIAVMLIGSTSFVWRTQKNLLAISKSQQEIIITLNTRIETLERRLRDLEMKRSIYPSQPIERGKI